MNPTGYARPKLNFLTKEQIGQIHQTAQYILSKVGVRFDSEKARQVFMRSKEVQIDEDNLVKFPTYLVDWALKQAPSVVDVYSRDGELAFRLGADRTRFGVGVTSLYYQEPGSGEITPFQRTHMTDLVRLGDHLPNYDVISTPGIVQDQPPEIADLYAVLEMTANTKKPLVMLISEEKLYEPALDMLAALHGDLAEKPFVLPYFNPISPLVVNSDTIEKIMITAERGLPFIYNTYVMAGVSAPITPAGMLAQMTAELLAGLIFTQLVKPGAPIILGMLPSYFDMKSMVNFYDPKSYLISLACVEILQHYGLPHSGTSGSGNGWMGDLIDFENYWLNHLLLVMGNAGLAPFVGDTLRSKVFSPPNVVYGNEIIEKALSISEGFVIDEESFGYNEIAGQGPGGTFLAEPLTLKHFRQAYTVSDIFPQYSMENWQEVGQPSPQDVLNQYTQDLLHSLPEPEDYKELLQKGERFINRL
ncbi:MAG TPA: trimethylamine methyltransferase family protein [Anaerolineales bacterium]|nr:trimethylamine methyltransferase family protein [Anaerolineales bacterium]